MFKIIKIIFAFIVDLFVKHDIDAASSSATRKFRALRFRNIYMTFGSIVVLFALVAVDPSLGWITDMPFGAGLLSAVLKISWIVILITMLHLSRRGLFDYVEFSVLYNKAKEEPVSAAIFAIAMAIIVYAVVELIKVAVQL